MPRYELSDDLRLFITPRYSSTEVVIWKYSDFYDEWDVAYSARHACGTFFEYGMSALAEVRPDVPAEAHEYMLNQSGLATEYGDDSGED